ncbi:MAG: UDP-N-acetylglucosamine 1-carboxyvinyltransferase [Candidatus Kapabacteria bacterium]|nr:UDP-N-acetylglucosamine 1-carboxyvinyltransferase [Candidatus Kapabacteria bacterium]MBX7156409.1 UDP-N-acetylglucosamine 1-carboxyvinyltransferase [Bacteroidota bacterium]
MDKFVIEGGHRLTGKVSVSGSKNALLALMPAVLLAPGTYTIHNSPNLRDVWTFSRLLGSIGVHCELNNNELFFDSSNITSYEAPYEHVKKMRASIYVLGPLVARYGKAKISLPGGCAFGPRPVDLHLKGMEKLGAKITLDAGYINAEAERLHGAKFNFDISSVGATVNMLLAASLAKGTSLLTNSATEPEVTALARMLVKMGAKIDGIGTTTLEIEGVDELHPVDETNIPDRIEAATFLIAAAMTQGKITMTNVNPYHLTNVVAKLEEVGCTVDVTGETIELEMSGPPSPSHITTAPYPGFPTDTQAQWTALMLLANGTSRTTDTIYTTRFGYVPELQRMGANIEIVDNTAIVYGGNKLQGTTVMSSDLRASASLILAALVAEGKTDVLRVYHLDRGYERLEHRLSALGANIKRVHTEEY